MALTDSLISYWKLDEASGPATDSHGANTLTQFGVGSIGTAAGKINTARVWTHSQSVVLDIADNASLSTGDIDFTFAAWVQITTKNPGDNQYVASKANSDPTLEWALFWRGFGGTDRFRFSIGANFAVNVDANNLGSPSTGVWYYVVCWHDSAADTINIQVNNGTVDSQATGGMAPADTGSEFQLGSFFFGFYWDGPIDECAFWKRVLTAQERSDLYNGGSGFAYPFVAASITQFRHTGTGRPPNP